MRLKDYLPAGLCPLCHKNLYVPASWTGRQRDHSFSPTPVYATCLHKEIISKRYKIDVR